MNHLSTPATRLLVAVAASALAVSLAGCSSATGTTGAGATRAPSAAAPASTASGDFCSLAAAAAGSASAMTAATDKLSSAMSDPTAISGDLTAMHTAGQAILDSSTPAAAYFAEGARIAEDPTTKDAFTGLSHYVSKYEVPLGKAGVESASYGEFATKVMSVVADTSLTALADNSEAWGATVQTFTAAKCGS